MKKIGILAIILVAVIGLYFLLPPRSEKVFIPAKPVTINQPPATVEGCKTNPKLPKDDLSNVSYGKDPSQRFDFYPATAYPCTFLVVVHGGGWTSGDKAKFTNTAKHFQDLGYPVANINYGLPSFFPDQPDDLLSVMGFLESNYGAEKFILYGHSAGGHLVGLTALSQNKIGGYGGRVAYPSVPIVAWIGSSGVYDYQLLADGGSRVRSPRGIFLHYAGGEAAAANPIAYADSQDMPCLLIAGDNDNLVPFQTATNLAAKIPSVCSYQLQTNKGHNDVQVYPGRVLNPVTDQLIKNFLAGLSK